MIGLAAAGGDVSEVQRHHNPDQVFYYDVHAAPYGLLAVRHRKPGDGVYLGVLLSRQGRRWALAPSCAGLLWSTQCRNVGSDARFSSEAGTSDRLVESATPVPNGYVTVSHTWGSAYR
jgi:hypothetical protein